MLAVKVLEHLNSGFRKMKKAMSLDMASNKS